MTIEEYIHVIFDETNPIIVVQVAVFVCVEIYGKSLLEDKDINKQHQSQQDLLKKWRTS